MVLGIALAGACASAALLAQSSVRTIAGSPSSARHCIAGYAANVHEIGWLEAGTVIRVTFDGDIPLFTGLSQMNLEGDTSLGGWGDPEELHFRLTESGNNTLFVGGNGRSGCYRYKVEVTPPAAAIAAVSTALPPLVIKARKNPIRTMAIAGTASSAKHCIAGSFVARTHDLGRVEQGATVRITFDSDFDPIAGVEVVDVVGRRGLFLTDNDAGGDQEPLLSWTSDAGGTLALYVASADGRAGCYRYRVEIEGGAAPQPTPQPTPQPAPPPAPGPAPGPAPSPGTFQAVWVSASWRGGATGGPTNSRGIDPPAGTVSGRLCLANQVRLENHPSPGTFFDNQFVMTNSCGRPLTIAYCRTAGSGGGASAIPVCATDPRQTPRSNVSTRTLGSARTALGESPANLDVNVFWCSDTTQLNALRATPVRGAAAMDCVPNN